MVDDIFDWYYPNAPMDLCFYRDGYCWYESTGHEGDASIYTEDQEEIDDIKEMKANIIWCGDFGHTPFMLNEKEF